eukprot:scaffold16912_cov112-Isochrysis_galbana.AAC.4
MKQGAVYLVQVCVVVSDGIDALLEVLGREIAVGVSAGQSLDGVLLGLDLALNGVAGLPRLRSNDLGIAFMGRICESHSGGGGGGRRKQRWHVRRDAL